MSLSAPTGFNEAAGFTQRKHGTTLTISAAGFEGFNEAAGFTQRKHVGNADDFRKVADASMRPPVLPSGNLVGIALRNAM